MESRKIQYIQVIAIVVYILYWLETENSTR